MQPSKNVILITFYHFENLIDLCLFEEYIDMSATSEEINLLEAFFLWWFIIFATSLVLVHLDTKMYNDLHPSPSVKIAWPDRALVMADLVLSIFNREERNDTEGPSRDHVNLKGRFAEICATVLSKLQFPIRFSPVSPDGPLLSETSAITKSTQQHRPRFHKGFHSLHFGLSPPSL